jgi:hypothetical protein
MLEVYIMYQVSQHWSCTCNTTIVACLRIHCCRRNATMRSVFIIELRVTVNNMKILSVVQQCFYDEFMSPATIKHT